MNKRENNVIPPKHVAIIMDGNRRWAREKGIPQLFGHKKGYDAVEHIIAHAIEKQIPYITFWAFSTENWDRSPEELKYLMDLFRRSLRRSLINRLKKKGIKLNIIGDLSRFPKDIIALAEDAMEETKENSTITVNFGLNYGGRAEILRAVHVLLQSGKKEVTESEFGEYLYTKGQPDPDLIIRTGGELRLSGYLLWQCEYSELYFTDVLWPDFDTTVFDTALEEFSQRQRRFGK